MNYRAIFHLISLMLMVIGLAMAACLGLAFYFHDPSSAQLALIYSSAILLTLGPGLFFLTRGAEQDFSRRDGICIVTFGWIFTMLFGALPYIFSGVISDPIAAVFETVSGFTTTGASVIADVDAVPKSILFWRALTHFFGGMGILVFCVAILPFIGVGGVKLYQTEMTGPSKDRLTPKIATTAKLLWGVYVLLTVVESVCLKIGGMTWFDAVCHSFATLATGGFSTRTISVAAYHSLYIEIVITVFMLLGACNYVLHYRLLRGEFRAHIKNSEFRFFMTLWLISCLAVTFNTWHRVYPDLLQALRASVFSVTSIVSTTGFSTDNFDTWPITSKIILLLLMVVGACAGSTGGAIKQDRLLIILKKMARDTVVFMRPQAVIRIKAGGELVEESVVYGAVSYALLYIVFLALASMLLTLVLPDAMSAVSAVAATTGGVGPGFNLVGPLQNYMAVPSFGKIILILCMLLGRLEFFPFMAMLFPSFWKK